MKQKTKPPAKKDKQDMNSDDEIAYRIFASGRDMGTYWAETRQKALDSYAKDAGYENYKQLANEHEDCAKALEIRSTRAYVNLE